MMTTMPELLAFRAPYLEERMVRERRVDSPEKVAALLDELKKYLVLSRVLRKRNVPMFSRLVDEIWHQFVLFTTEYDAFCRHFFGRFVEHAPAETPPSAEDAAFPPRPELTRHQFNFAYSRIFGPVSALWQDELSVDRDTRLTRKPFRRTAFVQTTLGKTEIISSPDDETPMSPLVRVDAWAAPALEFLVAHDHFYVRELPGLDDEDRIAICRPLVARGILRITL
jgi:hypothetical protein